MATYSKLGFLLVATLVAAPAWSQIYKWVDENGTVNYTNQPPSNGKAEEFDLNSARLSVIETDSPEQLAVMKVQSEVGLLQQKVGQLESQLEAERYVRQYTAESAATPVESGYVYPGYLYAPAYFVRNHPRRPHVRPTRFIQTPMAPGHSVHGMQHAGFPNQNVPIMTR